MAGLFCAFSFVYTQVTKQDQKWTVVGPTCEVGNCVCVLLPSIDPASTATDTYDPNEDTVQSDSKLASPLSTQTLPSVTLRQSTV